LAALRARVLKGNATNIHAQKAGRHIEPEAIRGEADGI
jgi:hypothetical protein